MPSPRTKTGSAPRRRKARFWPKQKSQQIGLPHNIPTTQTWFTDIGKPVWSPRDYGQFATEGYCRNVIAYRSVNLVAQSASSVCWKLFYDAAGEITDASHHPLLKLLNRPNPLLTCASLVETLISYRLISGNAYLLAISPKNGQPKELYPLRPDRIKVIAGENNIPQGYEYTVGNRVIRYPVNPVTGFSPILHIKQFHPTNDWYGLSAIEAASYSIDQHNQAAVWNQALLQNGAKPSGALVVRANSDGSGGRLTDDQFLKLKSQVDEHYSGVANAGRPLLLEGGLEWKEMSLSPRDMDFIEAKHSAARDIALAFGVPPQLLGIPGDNTYSNLMEARIALWEQTVLPILDQLATSLNQWLVPAFEADGQNLTLTYDAEKISALTPRREAVWKRLENASFMSLNEKRHAVGLPAVDGGDSI